MARMSTMAGALTDAEYELAIEQFPRLSEKARQVAKAVLVHGRAFDDIAIEFDTSRQLIHIWATKVYEKFRPDGWLTETVTLPPELMDKVKAMEAKARKEWAKAQPPPRVTRR